MAFAISLQVAVFEMAKSQYASHFSSSGPLHPLSLAAFSQKSPVKPGLHLHHDVTFVLSSLSLTSQVASFLHGPAPSLHISFLSSSASASALALSLDILAFSIAAVVS